MSSSSTAKSSLLILLLGPGLTPCLHTSEAPEFRWLYVEEVRDRGKDGGGIEMLARSQWASVVPGSA